MAVNIEIGKSYQGLVNGIIFKVIREVKNKYTSSKDKYFLVEFPDRPDIPELKRIYSECYLRHLLIKAIN